MKSILEELWSGNISPWSEATSDIDEERRICKRLTEVSVELGEMLNERGRELLAAIDECHMDLQNLLRKDAFISGFSVGARITAEALLLSGGSNCPQKKF